jgi:hypothetical protein
VRHRRVPVNWASCRTRAVLILVFLVVWGGSAAAQGNNQIGGKDGMINSALRVYLIYKASLGGLVPALILICKTQQPTS